MRKLKLFLGVLACFCLVGAVCIYVHDWIEVERRYDAILAGYDDLLADYQALSTNAEKASPDQEELQCIAEARREADFLHELMLKVADEEYFERLVTQYGEEEAKYQQALKLEYLRLEYDEAVKSLNDKESIYGTSN